MSLFFRILDWTWNSFVSNSYFLLGYSACGFHVLQMTVLMFGAWSNHSHPVWYPTFRKPGLNDRCLPVWYHGECSLLFACDNDRNTAWLRDTASQTFPGTSAVGVTTSSRDHAGLILSSTNVKCEQCRWTRTEGPGICLMPQGPHTVNSLAEDDFVKCVSSSRKYVYFK